MEVDAVMLGLDKLSGNLIDEKALADAAIAGLRTLLLAGIEIDAEVAGVNVHLVVRTAKDAA
jgi:hypothetical protein